METITIRNAAKRAYTLPVRVAPKGDKFGGVMLKPQATLAIPAWYLEALMEERSIAILFVEKKIEALDRDGEPVRFQKRDLVPKKVMSPKYAAPEPEMKFPAHGDASGRIESLIAMLEEERAARLELEAKLDRLLAKAKG